MINLTDGQDEDFVHRWIAEFKILMGAMSKTSPITLPTKPPPEPCVIWQFSGMGKMSATPIELSKSLCRLHFKVDWTGTIQLMTKGEVVVNQWVWAGQTYSTCLRQKGYSYFHVVSAPVRGQLILTIVSFVLSNMTD